MKRRLFPDIADASTEASRIVRDSRMAIPRRRRGAERQRAVGQLRALAASRRFRVQVDGEGFPFIPGRYGRIEWYCDGLSCASCALPGQFALAVFTDRTRLFQTLWAISGVTPHQTGNQEMRAVFPPDMLDQVAAVIRAHRKPGVRSEAAKTIGAGTAFEATSRPLEPRSAAGTAPEPGAPLNGTGGV